VDRCLKTAGNRALYQKIIHRASLSSNQGVMPMKKRGKKNWSSPRNFEIILGFPESQGLSILEKT
jgi:hypothetical protein